MSERLVLIWKVKNYELGFILQNSFFCTDTDKKLQAVTVDKVFWDL
jgi:hypothetical protein